MRPTSLIGNRFRVDEIYEVTLPMGWITYKSDRFRAKSPFDNLQFSISNFSKPIATIDLDGVAKDLHQNSSQLFDKFVSEGGYVAYNDRDFQKDYAYQAFQVDEETQYYFYTFRTFGKKVYRINFILREVAPYDPARKQLLFDIAQSIVQ